MAHARPSRGLACAMMLAMWLRRAFRCVVALLASLGLVVAAATATPVVRWWATWLSGTWNDPTGDTLIVLGGSVLDTGIIGQSSYWRAVYAVMAYRHGKFREVVVSGGGPPCCSVAEPIRDFLVSQGVPRELIRLENRSHSTRQNALYVAEMLAGTPGRKVLLTSDYHMFRAYRAFRKAGLDVTPAPFADARKRAATWTSRWPAFLDLVTETSKIGYYYARGWI